jgi:hypothetical protein
MAALEHVGRFPIVVRCNALFIGCSQDENKLPSRLSA